MPLSKMCVLFLPVYTKIRPDKMSERIFKENMKYEEINKMLILRRGSQQ